LAEQGLHGFLAAHGFLAEQGFFAAHGLQGFLAAHGFFAAQGLQAAIWIRLEPPMLAAAAGSAVVAAARATMLSVVMVFLIMSISQKMKAMTSPISTDQRVGSETVQALNRNRGNASNQHILTRGQQVVTKTKG
jgi:hypothetical protein